MKKVSNPPPTKVAQPAGGFVDNGFIGRLARDRVSGFEGVIMASHVYLHGCTRHSIQPPAEDGKLPDSASFDEPSIEILNAEPVVPLYAPATAPVAAAEPPPAPPSRNPFSKRAGGPEKYPDKRRV